MNSFQEFLNRKSKYINENKMNSRGNQLIADTIDPIIRKLFNKNYPEILKILTKAPEIYGIDSDYVKSKKFKKDISIIMSNRIKETADAFKK